MNHCVLKKLTAQEMTVIYKTYLVNHFPENEVKPLSAIERMLAGETYTGYGMYDSEEKKQLLCYAFFAVLPDRKNILLDYFAVMEEYRSHGLGSLFLAHMKETICDYDGLLIEAEDPAFGANEADSSKRRKRIAFYKKSGAVETGILAEVFGVHYRLLYFPIQTIPSLESLFTDFDAIYQHMVSKKHYDADIQIYMDKQRP